MINLSGFSTVKYSLQRIELKLFNHFELYGIYNQYLIFSHWIDIQSLIVMGTISTQFFFSSLIRENNWFKCISVVLFIWWLYRKLLDFFIKKPTQIPEKYLNMDQLSFPLISICSIDAFDSSILNQNGYATTLDFFWGSCWIERYVNEKQIFGIICIVEYMRPFYPFGRCWK